MAYLPRFVPQLDGSAYAGLNCNCASAAMALDRDSKGSERTTGARVRQLTGDKVGGTRLSQVDSALFKGWAVDLNTHTPLPLDTFDVRLDEGKGGIVQGRLAATHGTEWQTSETFVDNHSWWCNARRKNSQVPGGYQYQIMDPLGDHRRPSVADFRKGLWLPRNVFLKFVAGLNVAKNAAHDYVALGAGKVYTSLTRDTEPALVLKYGAVKLTPPRRRVAHAIKNRQVNVRTAPTTSAKVVALMDPGDSFIAFQRTDKGQKVAGSSRWYGNQAGTRWVHTSGLRVP